MSILQSLSNRRSYYDINKDINIEENKIVELVQDITSLVPDAFNMKSSKVVLALGKKHDLLWDSIYDAYDGKVSREKIDSFKSGYGSVLYFIDNSIVENMQKQFELYAHNFPIWAMQASGMLQISIWSGLRDIGLGASLQHYNPVIDEKVKALFDVPAHYELVAQMPFGNIVNTPSPKDKEDISKRVKVVK